MKKTIYVEVGGGEKEWADAVVNPWLEKGYTIHEDLNELPEEPDYVIKKDVAREDFLAELKLLRKSEMICVRDHSAESKWCIMINSDLKSYPKSVVKDEEWLDIIYGEVEG